MPPALDFLCSSAGPVKARSLCGRMGLCGGRCSAFMNPSGGDRTRWGSGEASPDSGAQGQEWRAAVGTPRSGVTDSVWRPTCSAGPCSGGTRWVRERHFSGYWSLAGKTETQKQTASHRNANNKNFQHRILKLLLKRQCYFKNKRSLFWVKSLQCTFPTSLQLGTWGKLFSNLLFFQLIIYSSK